MLIEIPTPFTVVGPGLITVANAVAGVPTCTERLLGKMAAATAGRAASVVPVKENAMLNVGAGAPPTMSVPMRSQSGSRLALRIQACRSPVNCGGLLPAAESQKNVTPLLVRTWGTKK